MVCTFFSLVLCLMGTPELTGRVSLSKEWGSSLRYCLLFLLLARMTVCAVCSTMKRDTDVRLVYFVVRQMGFYG